MFYNAMVTYSNSTLDIHVLDLGGSRVSQIHDPTEKERQPYSLRSGSALFWRFIESSTQISVDCPGGCSKSVEPVAAEAPSCKIPLELQVPSEGPPIGRSLQGKQRSDPLAE
jgi:hypothetical protein